MVFIRLLKKERKKYEKKEKEEPEHSLEKNKAGYTAT